MTLAFYSSAIVQDALRSLDSLRANTETLMEEGVIRTVDGQAVQSADSLLRHLVRQAIANGTEVEVGRAGLRDEDSPPGLSSLGVDPPGSPGSDEGVERAGSPGLTGALRDEGEQAPPPRPSGKPRSRSLGSDKTLPLGKGKA